MDSVKRELRLQMVIIGSKVSAVEYATSALDSKISALESKMESKMDKILQLLCPDSANPV
jgi:hypothetical protein